MCTWAYSNNAKEEKDDARSPVFVHVWAVQALSCKESASTWKNCHHHETHTLLSLHPSLLHYGSCGVAMGQNHNSSFLIKWPCSIVPTIQAPVSSLLAVALVQDYAQTSLSTYQDSMPSLRAYMFARVQLVHTSFIRQRSFNIKIWHYLNFGYPCCKRSTVASW